MNKQQSKKAAKRIVLLSDGTGNSPAKLMRTNIWRMYQAIDVSSADQIAMYDNGVGSSSFKPAALLGGSMGWGLKRNLLDLYMFACRNYGEAVDEDWVDKGGALGTTPDIFLFGFSRGAFTVRLLAGLIADQGLITHANGRELKRRAKWAYRTYRRSFQTIPGRIFPFTRLKDGLFRLIDRLNGKAPYDARANARPAIRFMGLWDTVGAYGLSIEELTRGWDKWVWPLSLKDQNPLPSVGKVCHALALDDERLSFHPVLFNEAGAPPGATTREEALSQVWFAGMHSDVGGGYPDDALAQVSLRWIAEEAKACGLRLVASAEADWRAHATPHGPMHDSRRGLGVFYRYQPRKIAALADDAFKGVHLGLPKVHESVLHRIASGQDAYAPIVLPESYAVVMDDAVGSIRLPEANPFEDVDQARARDWAQAPVWDSVLWRRVAYLAMAWLTALIVALPFIARPVPGGPLTQASVTLTALIRLAGAVLPDSLNAWLDYFARWPIRLATGATAFGVLWLSSSRLQRGINTRMLAVWHAITDRHPAAPVVELGPRKVARDAGRVEPAGMVNRMRSSKVARRGYRTITERVVPGFFGFACFVGIWALALVSANRVVFDTASVLGRICGQADTTPAKMAGGWEVPFESPSLCQATGITLTAGNTYRLRFELPAEGWADGRYPVRTTHGIDVSEHLPVYLLGLPARRLLAERWYVPIARIEHIGRFGLRWEENHALSDQPTDITPRRTGPLFVFMNDAVGVPFGRYYRNNHGRATIRVTELTPQQVEP